MVLKWLIILAIAAVLCYAAVIGFVCLREKQAANDNWKQGDYDAIIVLGAQVYADGEPSVQLAWRLNAAAEAWREKAVPVVTCGAQGSDEPAPEAVVMKEWLIARGLPEEMILTDDTSVNTRENIRNAAEMLKDSGAQRVLIVTSDYHLPRAMALAADEGLAADGLGSPCKQEYWLKNHAREALSWGKYLAQKYLRLNLR